MLSRLHLFVFCALFLSACCGTTEEPAQRGDAEKPAATPTPAEDGARAAKGEDAQPAGLYKGPCEVVTTCASPEVCQGSGYVNTIERWTWGDDGRIQRVERDDDQDKVIDMREESVWSDDGRKRTLTRTYLTEYVDGGKRQPAASPQRSIQIEHLDAEGRVTRVEHDEDGDGKIESATLNSYDAKGRLIEEQIDEGANGSIEHHVWHRLDDKGEYKNWADHDYPDSDEACFTHPTVTRDDKGRIVREENHANICDRDELLTHTYDAQGNKLKTTVDFDKDGKVNISIEYSYNCWEK